MNDPWFTYLRGRGRLHIAPRNAKGWAATILFGLGAVGLAMHPEGTLAQLGNAVLRLFGQRRVTSAAGARPVEAPPDEQSPPAAPEPDRGSAGVSAAHRDEIETIPAGGKA